MQNVIPLEERTFAFFGDITSRKMRRLAADISDILLSRGHTHLMPDENPKVLFHFVSESEPIRKFRRNRENATWTYSTVLIESRSCPGGMRETLGLVYPVQIQAYAPDGALFHFEESPEVHITTMEQGHYVVNGVLEQASLVEKFLDRFLPRGFAKFVIKTEFENDLPEELTFGDEITRQIYEGGRTIESWGLLPAPYPIDQILPPKELHYLKLMFGIGGLSYGNLSARTIGNQFWMSATGVNKANLKVIGRDILWVKGYDPERNVRLISIPPGVKNPSYPSVDLIEHYMIYTENPGVGAIVHIHGWMERVVSTEANYPCGTYELGRAVADLVKSSPNPAKAVVGLKNHGLTITGESLSEIFARIAGKIVPQVPMS